MPPPGNGGNIADKAQGFYEELTTEVWEDPGDQIEECSDQLRDVLDTLYGSLKAIAAQEGIAVPLKPLLTTIGSLKRLVEIEEEQLDCSPDTVAPMRASIASMEAERRAARAVDEGV